MKPSGNPSDHVADADSRLVTRVPPWEQHTAAKPCLACRYLVKGNEHDAPRWWCTPELGGCGHFHRGPCPEIEK